MSQEFIELVGTVLDGGAEALRASRTDRELLAALASPHPTLPDFREATGRALRLVGIDDPETVADEVVANFVWTQFVVKPFMVHRPAAAIDYASSWIDIDRIAGDIEGNGPAVITAFHHAGFPLVAAALLLSPVDLVTSKARRDDLDPGSKSDDIIYITDRSAGISLVRALRSGRSAWVTIDVAIPGATLDRRSFLGQLLAVAPGLDSLIEATGIRCLPVHWSAADETFTVSGEIVAETAGGVMQAILSQHEPVIRTAAGAWLEWYALLGESVDLRPRVKAGNELLWGLIKKTGY